MKCSVQSCERDLFYHSEILLLSHRDWMGVTLPGGWDLCQGLRGLLMVFQTEGSFEVCFQKAVPGSHYCSKM